MRRIILLLLLTLFVTGCGQSQSLNVKVPTKWDVGPVLLTGGEKGTFDDVAVKDPTIVNYGGKWHLFYTISGKDPGGIGYVSADTLEGLQTAPRFWLDQFVGQTNPAKGGAPQVFYFEPQKLWYLIYQTKDFNRQPVYSTTKTIDKPESWTKTRNLIPREEPDIKWIDFWVLCDDENAYFFYCRGRKDVYVKTTKIEDFPNGFGPGQFAFSPMNEPLCEAVHVYKAKGKKQYHMLYETRPPGMNIRRYGLAVAPHPLGPWKKVADDYIIGEKLVYSGEVKPWTDVASHGEMIRTGYNQKLEYDSDNIRFMIQGETKEKHQDYTRTGWKLGIIRPLCDENE